MSRTAAALTLALTTALGCAGAPIDDKTVADWGFFDPTDQGLAPKHMKELTTVWGRCSQVVYEEYKRLAYEKVGSSAYQGVNCAWDESIDAAFKHFDEARAAGAAGDQDEALRHFAATMYIAQSLYTRSEYIEHAITRFDDLASIPVLKIWKPDSARKALKDEWLSGVRSGTSSLASPKHCPTGALRREQIDKGKGGARADDVIARWESATKWDAVKSLALRSSMQIAFELQGHAPKIFEGCLVLAVPITLTSKP